MPILKPCTLGAHPFYKFEGGGDSWLTNHESDVTHYSQKSYYKVPFGCKLDGLLMRKNPSYQELQQKVKALEKQVLEFMTVQEELRCSEQKYRDLYEKAPIASGC